MQINKVLLKILADGRCHSGEKLAGSIGVSRTAIWKEMQKLSQNGFLFDASPGAGYRLFQPIELLNNNEIAACLSVEAAGSVVSIEILDDVDSTNTYSLTRLREGVTSCFVTLAETQAAGRGRNGRHWHSPLGKNIYLSLAWRFTEGASVLEGLSLAVGVAIVRALKNIHGDLAYTLKWPNDIYLYNKKLGGILIELVGDISGVCDVVVGIGINVAMDKVSGEDIPACWTSFSQEGVTVSRNQLAASIINELVSVLTVFQQQGFGAFRDEWNAMSAFHGRKVMVSTPVGQCNGFMLDVGNNGALRIDCDGRIKEFFGGDVSLSVAHDT